MTEHKHHARTYTGVSLAPGYGEGAAYVYCRDGIRRLPRYRIHRTQVETEVCRLEQALEKSTKELESFRERVASQLGDKEANIFHAHLALLRDPDFVNNCKARISRDLMNVEHAVHMATRDLERLLLDLENEYLRERAQDMRDIGQRVLKHLAIQRGHPSASLASLPDRSVIVAHELLPSDTVEMDRQHVAAIVTELGGPSSHAAILARALGVPSVTRVRRVMKHIRPNDWVLVDGEKGAVTISVPDGSAGEFEAARRRYEAASASARAEELSPCTTRDNVTMHFYANIGRVEDASEVPRHGLEGAGLVRTEFLFLNVASPPDVHTHEKTYRSIGEVAGKKPIVLRTLDLGGDKWPAFLSPANEANPGMGLRGLRFSLSEQRLLRTQLRGMLRASRRADIRILFPMVLGADDLQEALDIVHTLAKEEGVPVPPVGAMIETPAAVFSVDDILALADFVSVGTNDLTQFILAVDREATGMVGYFSILHPAVLKAVRHVVAQARKTRKEASICGEAAGDPATAGLLLGMGFRHFSMSPTRVARVRQFLRNAECDRLEATAKAALAASSPNDVEKLLTELTIIIGREAGLGEPLLESTGIGVGLQKDAEEACGTGSEERIEYANIRIPSPGTQSVMSALC